MRVLVTSGGTREYIDDVRVLTNISSGRLGAIIAENYYREGHKVTLVTTKSSVHPEVNIFDEGSLEIEYINTVDELVNVMKKLVPEVDVVTHAMAVSDFGFDRSKPIKLKSNDLEAFIEHLRSTIKMNPKVISTFREMNPKAILVGFKFEVGKTTRDLIEIAAEFLTKNKLDFVLANDKEEMQRKDCHIGYLIDSRCQIEDIKKLEGKEAIAEEIVKTTIDQYKIRNPEMRVSEEKKNEIWDYCLSLPKRYRPNGITERRLDRSKEIIFSSEYFWDDIVWRHGLGDKTPEELKKCCIQTYNHFIGNFWGMMAEIMWRNGILKN